MKYYLSAFRNDLIISEDYHRRSYSFDRICYNTLSFFTRRLIGAKSIIRLTLEFSPIGTDSLKVRPLCH